MQTSDARSGRTLHFCRSGACTKSAPIPGYPVHPLGLYKKWSHPVSSSGNQIDSTPQLNQGETAGSADRSDLAQSVIPISAVEIVPTPVIAALTSSGSSVPSSPISVQSPIALTAPLARPTPTALPLQPATPITRISIASIGLNAEVVEAPLVDRDGVITWDIPKFKAGHAQLTAGAGDLGNAVLLGHVSSLRSGDVFKDLESIKIGEEMNLVDDRQNTFVYRVTETRTVLRTDTSMVATTEDASVTLFTCTGTWLPLDWDFSHRFIVRGTLHHVM